MSIRFSCPNCKSILESPDESAGSKLACGKCGQRLQVPQPPAPVLNKTILGNLEPSQAEFAAVEPVDQQRQKANPSRQDNEFARCYECGCKVPINKIHRREVKTGRTRFNWAWGQYGASHYEKVDLCRKCADVADETKAQWEKGVTALVIIGISALGVVLVICAILALA